MQFNYNHSMECVYNFITQEYEYKNPNDYFDTSEYFTNVLQETRDNNENGSQNNVVVQNETKSNLPKLHEYELKNELLIKLCEQLELNKMSKNKYPKHGNYLHKRKYIIRFIKKFHKNKEKYSDLFEWENGQYVLNSTEIDTTLDKLQLNIVSLVEKYLGIDSS